MTGTLGGGTRTLAQQQYRNIDGLAKGGPVRSWRAGVRFVISSLPEPEGRIAAAALIQERPANAATLPTEDVLGWIHGFGSSRTCRMLADADLRTNKPVGELTDRQARVLANLLVASVDDERGSEAA